jgi:hypothetical protein
MKGSRKRESSRFLWKLDSVANVLRDSKPRNTIVWFTVPSDDGEPGSLISWRETGVHSRYPALACGNDVGSSFDENCQVLAL